VKHKSRIGVGVGWPGWGAEGDRNRKKENPKLLSKPLEYHALGGQPFRIPSAGKHTIEKVKPLQGTIALHGRRWKVKKN